MNFIDRLAEQAKTPEQALRDFQRPEPMKPTAAEPKPREMKSTPEPLVPTLDDAFFYRNESGVGKLVKRLGTVLASDMIASGNDPIIFSRGKGFGPDYEIEAVDHLRYPLRKMVPHVDKLAVLDEVVWYDTEPSGLLRGKNFIGVFSYPDATIGFFGKNYANPELVSLRRWGENPEVIVQTLERYFNRDYGNERDYSRFAKEESERMRIQAEDYYSRGRKHPTSGQRGPWS